ncbi:exosortase family protein XrtF [Flavobacterium sp. L1I52]|uniref:Exosortase family protein XrtF n=1 Tax=Flavobacterium pokkalii TaxID=1940408 RepID=A0ABR7UMH9_9FLAO|nr:exosortase family protein XrtF [Flavobacterium pokkalii]MBD0724080.1 exosortase family protein XrtF [Flavobacterium pokkalii]
MKKYLILYRPFLVFLAKFFLTYAVLTLIYQGYLSRFDGSSVDSITHFVAENTKQLLHLFGVDFRLKEVFQTGFITLFYNQQAVARMIEGCNAVSVIILFAAFIVAFSGKKRTTLIFILAGSFFIYVLNVVRIALLCSALYWFPDHEGLLHEIVFPLFIYGVVFVLWVIWVNKFSLYVR